MDYKAEEIALAVANWIEQENAAEAIRKEKKAAVADFDSRIKAAEMEAEVIRLQLEALLKEYGVAAEDVDIGAYMNIRIAMQKYQPPLEVVGIEAVPDDFIRIKKEINKELINATYRNAEALPNWLTRPDATYKLVKREVKKVSEDAKDVG